MSGSRIKMITRIARIARIGMDDLKNKDITEKITSSSWFSKTKKSVKSINPSKSVIQTIYDIVTKGHGGTLEVESKEGEGTELLIRLPIVWITD